MRNYLKVTMLILESGAWRVPLGLKQGTRKLDRSCTSAYIASLRCDGPF